MADINIQIKQRNGEIWDNLYPKTKAENVTESAAKRFVSDTEKASWNGKQTALDFTPENASKKGTANGYAELDASGKVPASQLPSYVDDVLEYANQAAFPSTGETGKIYIAIDTNQTYRWGGTGYVEISASLALGETSNTAYRGDRGKTAYDHSQSAHASANAQKNSDITKAEIEAKLTGVISSHSHASGTPSAHGATHITGGADVIPGAVAGGNAGLMSGVDKSKLDGLPNITVNVTEPESPSSGDLWYAII
ncbi:hypothetical protein [Desulfitobacterium chlororespirans]|uniref:Uncharacterized protein n=1 Tax=Desulfitobacterium chlororespirans DSM 11544 TaxID=1121395 RepID=A0A1M7T5R0_9FIRM|nr:hypothetical protein [Desulfitobacterium chlororespirans]SHN66071.1 hypothetical protein SAMN02745215_01613 [Desulfitobacterium chlororespirans DSM 11544]